MKALTALRAGSLLATILLFIPSVAMSQTWNFSTCAATGATGPDQAACNTAYTATNLAGDVTVNAGKQSWTAPTTGIYLFTTTGAAGNSATEGEYDGGRGARLTAEFQLTAGDTLQIVVGQQGLVGSGGNRPEAPGNGPDGPSGDDDDDGCDLECDGGGGGGSFIVDAGDNPLLIAGGGGGTRHNSDQDGCDANAEQYATDSSGSSETGGCTTKVVGLGLGGVAIVHGDYGSAGAGFNGNGESDEEGQGGFSWANGMNGGHSFEADGGFGGGGSGEGSNGGGGGGGYSGGDGGHIAGGGGSFFAGSNPTALEGVSSGDGDVSIELLQAAETRATFKVTKDFRDDEDGGPANTTEVDVTLDCFTGLPIMQSQTISQTRDATFIIKDFTDGELDCIITEDTDESELKGYTPTYYASVQNQQTFAPIPGSPIACEYTMVAGGEEYLCHIENDADPVRVAVEKKWIIELSGGKGNYTNKDYMLTLYCDAPIEGGKKRCKGGFGGFRGQSSGGRGYESCKEFGGDSNRVFTNLVTPEWPSSECWVTERIYDDAVDTDNRCTKGKLTISHGMGADCKITNTVFFEGIPTLSQYGMAILALLMLGIGMVGFRRFV